MGLPLGLGFDGNIRKWVIMFNESHFKLRQTSANWFDILKTGLEVRHYHKYQVDTFVFYLKDPAI